MRAKIISGKINKRRFFKYRFQVDFGSIVFPDDLGMIPMTVVIADGFVEKAHDVRSGTVTFINERQVYIMNFNYDGTGPGK